jgi:tetraacyldisaccharide 4'-kinase
MSSKSALRSFRLLLLPFAILYRVVIGIRNWLYDRRIIRSASFAMPIICVGNLAVGGTGKSPMVEYLVELVKGKWKTATLSRGYKRKTRGYALANERTTALEIGDEPMQFHIKFPDIAVAVGEERLVAVPQLLHDRPETEVIILDDAFQHRRIRAGLNILLTECGNLFTRDYYLPAGDLRDLKSRYKKASVIVVTKCDPSLTEQERQKIISEIKPIAGQTVYFTAIRYGKAYHIIHRNSADITADTEVLMVSGIANPKPLQVWLDVNSKQCHLQQYSDHHIFTIDDLKQIRKKFEAIASARKMILTTEKDAVRLVKFGAEIKDWPLYVIPVRHDFLFNEAGRFNQHITNFISEFKTSGKT